MSINVVGCSLVDNLYSPINFKSDSYIKWSSGKNSGKGIITGGLVFGESLENAFGVFLSICLRNFNHSSFLCFSCNVDIKVPSR